MSSLPVNSRWAALEKDSSSSRIQAKGKGGGDQHGSQSKSDHRRGNRRGGDRSHNDDRDDRSNQPRSGAGGSAGAAAGGGRGGGNASRNAGTGGGGNASGAGVAAGASNVTPLPTGEPTKAIVTAVVPGSHVLCRSATASATAIETAAASEAATSAVPVWRLPWTAHPMVATLMVGDAVWVHALAQVSATSTTAQPPETMVTLAPACVRVPLTVKEGSDDRGEDGAPPPLVVSSSEPAEQAAPPPDSSTPPSPKTRPLIVLDLNGVLVDRKPYNTRHNNAGSGGRRRGGGPQFAEYQRRPFCDAFVSFCFRHFDVAVGHRYNLQFDLVRIDNIRASSFIVSKDFCLG